MTSTPVRTGPLTGVRILEIGGIGPNPFCGMLLADLGADVLRVDRAGSMFDLKQNPTLRGRATVGIDLKHPDGVATLLDLCESADALIEGFRPGVMERLGLGPEAVHARNPKLVYGRMTGYGQEGPMSLVAGHDINYISLAGALGGMARKGERPLFPLNLAGDYGGGAMYLAFGLVCGIVEARTSGQGQVVDVAMVDGAASLTAMFWGLKAVGMWNDREPGTNLLDSGAHFYETYTCSDGGHVAVGAIEPQFYARLLELLEIPADEMPQFDMARWPEFKERFAALFATRTRDEWAALLEPEETCATAVYLMGEAPEHPHMAQRETFVEVDGVLQPNVAPRFERTPGTVNPRWEDADAALDGWGVDGDARARLRESGALT